MKWRPFFSALLVSGLFVSSIIFLNIFPGSGIGLRTDAPKKVILYYNYGENGVTFNVTSFPEVVSFAKGHGFNSLMIVIYTGHHSRFNNSILQSYYLYAKSQNITFVPSYYIQSLNDSIDFAGFNWINLDMESLSQSQQEIFYDNISRFVDLVSVTMPYGENPLFQTRMLIIETYMSLPSFWFYQLSYSHGGTICSVRIHDVDTEQQYQSEFQYCLKYSEGVMVFDYPQLLSSGY